MSALTRGLFAVATAGALSFPMNPPASVTQSAPEAGRRHSAAVTTPATPAPNRFVPADLEFYLTEDGVAYIRPGLKIKVNSVTVGSDKKPVVDFNLTDDLDQPLDRLGKITPGAVSLSWILAGYNAADRHYTAYTVRTQTTPATSPRPGVSAVQASTDTAGAAGYTDLDVGHYTYKYAKAFPADVSASQTQTVGIYSTRNLTDIVGKNYFANVEYNFRLDGAKVTETWDKINQATSCNNCHDPLALHGGSRRDVKLCVLCHQEQTVDPDTGNTVDLKVMVHKIHRGHNLPSVVAGTPYQIIGFNQTVLDFSTVALPQDIRNCSNCHVGTNEAAKPSQSTVYLEHPSKEACGACHDDVNWVTGENHPAGPQADNSACANCHVPDSGEEYDASIKGAHTIPEKSKQLKGLTASVVSVTDLAPDKTPTVVFAIKNGDGSAVDGSKLTSFAPIFAGPTGSYSKSFREAAQSKATFDETTGQTKYTFTAAVPADATGTWTVSADIYRSATLKRADGKADITVREAAFNPIKNIAITGSVTPRRQVVVLAQCNTCHDRLALHGGQRLNTQECVICHNPVGNDSARRPATEGAPESISFQRLIHRIHTGEELTQEFTVFGFGGSKNNFNEVLFPGDRRNCAKCHTGNSQSLPVATSADSVNTPRDYFSPQGPGTAACLGCHDNRDAAAHAFLNTANFPGSTNPAEACATCHGTNKDWAVDKVHAR
jgi:OmcA/MtrC family decaheme c-type cytochrome